MKISEINMIGIAGILAICFLVWLGVSSPGRPVPKFKVEVRDSQGKIAGTLVVTDQ